MPASMGQQAQVVDLATAATLANDAAGSLQTSPRSIGLVRALQAAVMTSLAKPLARMSSYRRSSEIKDIGREIVRQQGDASRAIGRIWQYAEADQKLSAMLREYGVDEGGLSDIYWKLCRSGAGQHVRGHWVASSALVFEPTLRMVLESWNHGQLAGDRAMYLSWTLLECFHAKQYKNT